ncbi:MAG: response regulator transcription factor [Anaerolineae bacterium]
MSVSQILIVEDNPAIYYTLNYLLESNGFQSMIAENVKDAIHKVNSDVFKLILLDLNLPDGQGKDLLYHLRKKMNNDVPVIVMSATLQDSKVHMLLEMGANDYVIKPFDVDELLHLIRHWAQHNVAH